MAESQGSFRFRRRGGFTVLTNGALRDPRLSLKTKGLFAVICSLPKDWRYSVSGLAAYCGAGRDAIRSALRELEGAGYLTREQLHGERGKFGGNAYVLRGESVLPLPGVPPTGEPSTGDPTRQKKERPKKEKPNPPIVPRRGDGVPGRRNGRLCKPEPDWKPERFAAFWAFYPRGENKQAAIRAWDKLRAEDSLIDTMAAALVRQKKRADWQQGVGIPYASTWLNGRRWEDEERTPDTAQPEAPQPRKYHMAVIDGEEVVVFED